MLVYGTDLGSLGVSYDEVVLVALEGSQQEVEVTLRERSAAFFGRGLWFGRHCRYLNGLFVDWTVLVVEVMEW